MVVFSCSEVGVLFSWLWVKRCDLAGIKKLGWYSVGRVRVLLVLNRFSRQHLFHPYHSFLCARLSQASVKGARRDFLALAPSFPDTSIVPISEGSPIGSSRPVAARHCAIILSVPGYGLK